MSKYAVPTDPSVYALVTWSGYRTPLRAHWAWRIGHYTWRTLCGQVQAGCVSAQIEPTCKICAARFAKICAEYDADHSRS